MFKLFKKFTKKQVVLIICSILFVAFHVGIELKIPDYMSKITVLVQTEGSKMSDILEQGFLMVLCALFSLLASFVVGYF